MCSKCGFRPKTEGAVTGGVCSSRAACRKRQARRPAVRFTSPAPQVGEAGWETWMST